VSYLKKLSGNAASFILGLFVGLVITALLAGGAFFILANKGLVVRVETEQLAAYIGGQVERQAVQEFPKVVDDLKAQVPHLVQERLNTGQLQAEIKISDIINIVLPAAALDQLDWYLQATVQETVYSLLDGMDLASLAAKLGEQASDMVRYSLADELKAHQALSIKTWWGNVPVFLESDGTDVKNRAEY
jgi:hypothetical protein